MKILVEKIEELKRDNEIRRTVEKRIKEFENIGSSSKAVFSELCFCLLTANWKAKESIAIQKELSERGFVCLPQKELQKILKEMGHRFHPQRAEYICLARKHLNIKEKIKGMDEFNAREWLVKNIKGLGYKEASHFLRNIGYKNVAIIDRHILNLLVDYRLIKKKPSSLNKKNYLEIEKILKIIAEKTNLNLAKLDLYMWYMKTGKILK